MRTSLLFSAVAILVMVVSPGCGDNDSSYEAAIVAKLRQCDLLSPGRIHIFGEPDTAEDRCEFDCGLAASCADLTFMLCSTGTMSPSTAACFDSCDGGDFVCADGSDTISEDWVCDGYEDCADGSDEAGCPTFDCADGSDTIPQAHVCNNSDDCADGSDEVGCPPPPQFQCADGSFIPEYMDCNNNPDCPDGSDEVGCAQLTCPQ